MAISFGRDNPYCSRCGDERGGDYGHETSECVYRSGMTVGDLAALRPDRAREIYRVAVDQVLTAKERELGIEGAS